MKTRTSDSNGSNLQAGLITPVRLARVGVAALALTAAGMGFFGAGSASADGPQRLGQTVNAGVTQSTQVTQIQTAGKGNFGKVNTTKVSLVQAGATGDGPADQEECDKRADSINSALDNLKGAPSDYYKNQWSSILISRINDAEDRGCFIVY
jgi:hypothetical protein